MKTTLHKLLIAGLLACAAACAWSPPAAAHGGPRVGFYFGGPGWWGPYPYGWYPPPYVVEQRPIVVQQEPPVYVQQPQQSSYWYYCPDLGYYPYVQSCPKGWVQVAPQPPAGR